MGSRAALPRALPHPQTTCHFAPKGRKPQVRNRNQLIQKVSLSRFTDRSPEPGCADKAIARIVIAYKLCKMLLTI